MPRAPILDAERLARDGRALHRLARALVRDEDLAQDLVQETWTATLRSPPDPERPLRPWLFEVLRNLVRARHRGRTRRQRREHEFAAVAASEAPTAEAALERRQLEQLVLEAVERLQEPFRSAVMLRYVEGQAAVDIARAQNIPAATVRSRANDGLERVRAELDRRHGGDRRTWRFALLPLAAPRPATAPGMPAVVTLVAAVLVLVAVPTVWSWRRGPAITAPPAGAAGPSVPRSALAARGAVMGDDGPAARTTGTARSPSGGTIAGARVVLSGRVLDSSRIPLAGALVRVSRSAQVDTVTDDGGAFRLPLAPGSYVIAASAAGFAPARQEIRLDADATTDFFLEPGAEVRGRVVLRGSGTAVAGATVVLLDARAGFDASPRATSDADGRFELRDLRAGSHQPIARRERLSGQGAVLTLVPAARLAEVIVEVAPGATLSGMVSDQAGRPLAGAHVALMHQRVPGVWIRTRADGGGRFTIDGVLPGPRLLLANAPGHLQREHRLVVEAAGAAGVALAMERGAVVSGKVVDERGQPMAGATILAIDAGNTARGRARSDAAGHFSVENLPAGDFDLQVVDSQHAAAAERRVRVAGQDVADVVVTMEPAASVAGRVTWQDGAPAAGVIVSVLRIQGLPIRKSTRSAADGAFQLGPLSPGRYIVDARLGVMRFDAAAWSADNPGRRTVELAPGRDRRDVALVLARPDRELAGTVLDPGGQPLGGATISARPVDGAGRAMKDNAASIAQAEKRYQVSSGADGRFRIAQLPEGSVTILVEHPAFATRRIERVAAGTTDLELRLTQR